MSDNSNSFPPGARCKGKALIFSSLHLGLANRPRGVSIGLRAGASADIPNLDPDPWVPTRCGSPIEIAVGGIFSKLLLGGRCPRILLSSRFLLMLRQDGLQVSWVDSGLKVVAAAARLSLAAAALARAAADLRRLLRLTAAGLAEPVSMLCHEA